MTTLGVVLASASEAEARELIERFVFGGDWSGDEIYEFIDTLEGEELRTWAFACLDNQ